MASQADDGGFKSELVTFNKFYLEYHKNVHKPLWQDSFLNSFWSETCETPL